MSHIKATSAPLGLFSSFFAHSSEKYLKSSMHHWRIKVYISKILISLLAIEGKLVPTLQKKYSKIKNFKYVFLEAKIQFLLFIKMWHMSFL